MRPLAWLLELEGKCALIRDYGYVLSFANLVMKRLLSERHTSNWHRSTTLIRTLMEQYVWGGGGRPPGGGSCWDGIVELASRKTHQIQIHTCTCTSKEVIFKNEYLCLC